MSEKKPKPVKAADNREMVKQTSKRYAQITKDVKGTILTRDEFLKALERVSAADDTPRIEPECKDTDTE